MAISRSGNGGAWIGLTAPMSEREWLEGSDSQRMLDWLDGSLRGAKLAAGVRESIATAWRLACVEEARLASKSDGDLAAAIRCIVGNPWKPWTFKDGDGAWMLAPAVLSLAATIGAERAFDRLPILADALEEAGCTDAAILGHCRVGGVHVRGCWVVDIVRGLT